MVPRVYQSCSATVANLNPILATYFLLASCYDSGTETRRPFLKKRSQALFTLIPFHHLNGSFLSHFGRPFTFNWHFSGLNLKTFENRILSVAFYKHNLIINEYAGKT